MYKCYFLLVKFICMDMCWIYTISRYSKCIEIRIFLMVTLHVAVQVPFLNVVKQFLIVGQCALQP